MKKIIASMAVVIAFASVSIGAVRADDMDHHMMKKHMMAKHMMKKHMVEHHMMKKHMMEHHDT